MLVLKVIFHFALLGIFLPSAFAQTEHNAKELFNQAMADVEPKFLPKGTLQKVRKALQQYRTSKGETK